MARALIGVRALDYRYRIGEKLALTAFAGAVRYDAATPAYGYYGGIGAQWRDVVSGFDLSLDLRATDKSCPRCRPAHGSAKCLGRRDLPDLQRESVSELSVLTERGERAPRRRDRRVDVGGRMRRRNEARFERRRREIDAFVRACAWKKRLKRSTSQAMTSRK